MFWFIGTVVVVWFLEGLMIRRLNHPDMLAQRDMEHGIYIDRW